MTLDEEDDYQRDIMIPLMKEAVREAVRRTKEAGLPYTYLRQVNADYSEIVVEHNGEITVLKTIPNGPSIKPGRYLLRRKDGS